MRDRKHELLNILVHIAIALAFLLAFVIFPE